jgi:hypothetical protein
MITRRTARTFVVAFVAKTDDLVVSLLAYDGPMAARVAWRHNLRTQIAWIGRARLRPDGRPIPEPWLRRWLFYALDDEPARYVADLIEADAELGYERNDRTPEEIAILIERFYRALAGRLARGESAADLVERLAS